MTARIINLRQARKRKAREAARTEATERAREHGRTKAERDLTRKLNERDARTLDGSRLDDEPE